MQLLTRSGDSSTEEANYVNWDATKERTSWEEEMNLTPPWKK